MSNAHDITKLVRIPEQDIEAIEKVINGDKEEEETKEEHEEVVEDKASKQWRVHEFKTIITDINRRFLKTIIVSHV